MQITSDIIYIINIWINKTLTILHLLIFASTSCVNIYPKAFYWSSILGPERNLLNDWEQ